MVCYRCGRELPDKSACCKGCGQQFRRQKRVRSESIATTLTREIPVGKKKIKAWRLIVRLLCWCALLTVLLYVASPLTELLGSKVEELTRPVEEYDPGSVVTDISGTLIECDATFADITVESEKAYADGSWQKDCTVNGGIRLRFLRREHADSWLNTHIYQLYPDVLEADNFAQSPTVSGYSSARIQFSSQTYAPDCVIEALCVTVGGFDYMFIAEVPFDSFEEQSLFIDEWFGKLRLVDADTGVEQLNPAAQPVVSTVDAITDTP